MALFLAEDLSEDLVCRSNGPSPASQICIAFEVLPILMLLSDILQTLQTLQNDVDVIGLK